MHAADPRWCARRGAAPAPSRDFHAAEVPTRHVCDLCGAEMFDHNCKIICPNCGYKRDCSDP
jgi:Zn finger protein HypA/HybF involved in hydrogenase expression